MEAEAKFDAGPIIAEGVYHVTDRYALRDELDAKIREAFFSGIERLEGTECRMAVERDGLKNIHKHFPVEKVDLLEDLIQKALRDDLYYWSYKVGAENLGLKHPFYIDHLIVIRIHYPYTVARRGGTMAKPPVDLAERMRMVLSAGPKVLINQVSRRLRKSKKIAEHKITFNPEAYHGEIPTAARAHGPHIDTWYGHSYDGINLWLSIEGVNDDNTIILYPELFGRPVDYDPKSMYLKAGLELPAPTKVKFKPKELLLFNPEMLHGTQVNISDETRVALTTRINPHEPRFNDDAPFNFEHWFSSVDMEKRRFGVTKLFPAHKFQGEPSWQERPQSYDPRTERLTLAEAPAKGQPFALCKSTDLKPGHKLALDGPGLKLLLVRDGKGIKAFSRLCPHKAVDLVDGWHDKSQIFCPGHGVAFQLKDGSSKCGEFKLRMRTVSERDGQIWLEPAEKAAALEAAE